MRLKIIVLIFLFFQITGYSQNPEKLYKSGIESLEKADYKNARNSFVESSLLYLQSNNIDGYLKSRLQSIQIDISNKKYKEADNQLDKLIIFHNRKQSTNDSLWIEIINAKALNSKNLGEFKKAITINNQLLETPRLRNEFSNKIYHMRSRIQIDLGTYDDAIVSANIALKDYQLKKDSLNQASIYNIIGVAHFFKDAYDSTLVYYQKSLDLKKLLNADAGQLAISTFNIGITHEALADYEKAIDYYGKAELLDLQDGGENIGHLSDIYVAMVNSYYSLGDYTKAEQYAKKALNLIKEYYEEDSPQASFVYVAYGNFLELQDKREEALIYIDKALQIRKKTYGENHRWTFESYFDLGYNYMQIKKYDLANTNLLNALEIAEKLELDVPTCYAKKGLGELYSLAGNYLEAEKLLKAANKISESVYGKFHDLSFETHYLLAENHFLSGKNTEAEKIISNLISLYNQNPNPALLLFIPELYDLENKIYLQSLNGIINKQEASKIVDNIELEIRTIKKIRSTYSSASSKIEINKKLDKVIENALSMCYSFYKKTDESRYLEMAFKLSEFNRSSTLLEGIQNISFKKIAGVPDKVLHEESTLNKKLARLKQQIHYIETDSLVKQKLNTLLSEQLRVNQSLENLLREIKAQYPKYYNLKYGTESVSIKELQDAILNNKQTLVEYYFGVNHSYIFHINKKEATVIEIENIGDVKNNISQFREHLANKTNLDSEAKYLCNALLSDFKIKERLIIIGDDILNYIPFEALKHDDKYLVEDYSISYVGSANLLSQKAFDFKFNLKQNWAGFAPNFMVERAQITNAKEITNIAELMEGKMYIGEDASLSNFISEGLDYSILHLATHSEIDNVNPLYNKLLFAKDSVNNELTASEIYMLPIKSDLAVLSACNTGFGTLERGEGVMSMSRAFHYAGVMSTVMSLWRVPDKETSGLMYSFYEDLKKGKTKDMALQNAKLNYLKNTDDKLLKHPYYWAGFVVSGNTSAISNSGQIWLILGIAILLLITAFYFKKQIFSLLNKR